MLFMQRNRSPDAGPAFPKKLLEKDPAELAASGKAEEILAYHEANPGKADAQTQDALAERFYSNTHWRANARLLAPLLSSAFASWIAGEALKGADRLHMTLGFACAVLASTLYGRYRSVRFERSISRHVPAIFEAGGASSEQAQGHYAFTVSQGEDAGTAFALLSGGKVTSIGAQQTLADTVARHGTREQALILLGRGGLTGFAESTLRARARTDEEPL